MNIWTFVVTRYYDCLESLSNRLLMYLYLPAKDLLFFTIPLWIHSDITLLVLSRDILF